MKKLILVLAVVFSTTCFAQTIPASSENEYMSLEYHGYTGYCNIGYIVGVVNNTDQEMDILITWANGFQLVHLLPNDYEVFWFWGDYVENSKIKVKPIAPIGIPSLSVKVTCNYY